MNIEIEAKVVVDVFSLSDEINLCLSCWWVQAVDKSKLASMVEHYYREVNGCGDVLARSGSNQA